MRFLVLVAPGPAVSLDDMKGHLRVDHDEDDNLIEALAAGAQSGFEDADAGILRRPVAYQRIEMELNFCCSNPAMLFGPIDDDEAIEIVHRDIDGADVLIAAEAYRIERIDALSPQLVKLSGWPTTEAVRIRCWVGLDPSAARIGNFQSAIKMHVQKIYDGVDDAAAIDAAINALLSPYRIFSI